MAGKARSARNGLFQAAEHDRYMRVVAHVKGEPYAELNYAGWLLDFTARDLSRLTIDEWLDLRCEAAIFAYDKGPSHLDLPSAVWPGRAAVRAMQRWLQDLWPRLRQHEVAVLDASVPTVLGYVDGKFVRLPQPMLVTWEKAFPNRLEDVLTDSDVNARLRFCLKCGKPFCANKRQMYCSGSCSLTQRTNKWRERNPDKFRAARREAYRRKMKAQHGESVQVGTRSRRTSDEIVNKSIRKR